MSEVLIIKGFGLNCEAETAHAFKRAGASVDVVHLADIIANELAVPGEEKLPGLNVQANMGNFGIKVREKRWGLSRGEPHSPLDFTGRGRALPGCPGSIANELSFSHYRMIALIGGFSFGDHLGAGRIMAIQFKCFLLNQLKEFIKNGGLILGICNGFQLLSKLGVLPFANLDESPVMSLTHNHIPKFRNSWVRLKINPHSPCVFTKGLTFLDLPIRHGEGRVLFKTTKDSENVRKRNLIAMTYANPKTNETTLEYPHNPNGSLFGIAGITDPSGRIFGLMPHPEGNIMNYHHPDWINRRAKNILPLHGDGLHIFKNAVTFIKTT